MPLYMYKCECGHEFEELAKFTEETQPCPECEKVAKRQMSAPSHRLNVFGKTLADGRVRDSMKRNDRPGGGSATFDNGRGTVV